MDYEKVAFNKQFINVMELILKTLQDNKIPKSMGLAACTKLLMIEIIRRNERKDGLAFWDLFKTKLNKLYDEEK